jgi:hypothetical protein
MNWRPTRIIVVAFSYFRWDGEAARVIGRIVANLFALFCPLLCFTKRAQCGAAAFAVSLCVHARLGLWRRI